MAISARVTVRSDLHKAAAACLWCVRHPGHAVRTLVRGLAAIHRREAARRSPLPAVPVSDLIGRDVVVSLSDFSLRNGNTSLTELAILGALARRRAPRVVLEIGTFDGTGALTLARNCPADAVVHTIDLPADAGDRALLERGELAYVRDARKLARRKYAGTDVEGRIVQWIGDSTLLDLDDVLHGRPLELAFVDGGHAYEVVASDTRKVLERLAPDGVVIWHDYAPAWPGVVRCLDELGERLPLRRVDGTALVVYDAASVSPRPGRPARV